MSTRANIHFVNVVDKVEHIESNIYRHCNGYPSGLGADLHDFLDEVNKLEDKRFGDSEYLAAKFLVWQAKKYSTDYDGKEKHYLDFLSVAPCLKDHGDIEYRYKVVCGDGSTSGPRPKIYVQPVPFSAGDEAVEIKGWKLIKTKKQASKMES
jgi:hypothetical protein